MDNFFAVDEIRNKWINIRKIFFRCHKKCVKNQTHTLYYLYSILALAMVSNSESGKNDSISELAELQDHQPTINNKAQNFDKNSSEVAMVEKAIQESLKDQSSLSSIDNEMDSNYFFFDQETEDRIEEVVHENAEFETFDQESQQLVNNESYEKGFKHISSSLLSLVSENNSYTARAQGIAALNLHGKASSPKSSQICHHLTNFITKGKKVCKDYTVWQ